MNKISKQLELNRQTVRRLDSVAMQAVDGGKKEGGCVIGLAGPVAFQRGLRFRTAHLVAVRGKTDQPDEAFLDRYSVNSKVTS